MIDKAALVERAIAWERNHPPNTGYTERVFRAVCDANLENGTNLLTQIAAQFTGKEEAVDLVNWDKPEDRLDYSNTYRYSLDQSVDCSSAWYVLMMIHFSINIGTWTEGILSKNKKKQVPWSERRIGDIVLWNFKEGRNVSHAGCIVVEPDRATDKGGMIAHTTSPKNPFRFESDSYEAEHRVGVYRVLTDEQYRSLFVDDHKDEPETKQDQPVAHQRYRYDGATFTNLRDVPGGKDIGDIKHGEIVEKFGSKVVDGVTWWQVDTATKTGWCANVKLFTLVTDIEKPEPVYPKYEYTGATYTNFRTEPKATKSTDQGDIKKGDIVERIDGSRVDGKTWWKVRFQGKTGWCANTEKFRQVK